MSQNTQVPKGEGEPRLPTSPEKRRRPALPKLAQDEPGRTAGRDGLGSNGGRLAVQRSVSKATTFPLVQDSPQVPLEGGTSKPGT